jgi:hypothetical protein
MAMGVPSANLQNFFELQRQPSNEKEREKYVQKQNVKKKCITPPHFQASYCYHVCFE